MAVTNNTSYADKKDVRIPPKEVNTLDIAALSTSLSQASLSQAVGMKVLNLAKGQAEQQGQSLVQMMNASLDPNLGKNLDIRV